MDRLMKMKKAHMILAWGTLFLLLSPQVLLAQEEVSCENAIAEANNHFLFGRFEVASTLLEECLKQDAFSRDEKPPVYKLLVQIYDADQLEEKVMTALAELLTVAPNYQPDPDDPPEFKNLVDSYKQERARLQLAEQERADSQAQVQQATIDQARRDSLALVAQGDRNTMNTARQRIANQRNEEHVRELYLAAEAERQRGETALVAEDFEAASASFQKAQADYEEIEGLLANKESETDPPPQKRSWVKWAIIGGGAAVVGIVIAIIPPPPPPPPECPDGTAPPCESVTPGIPLPPANPGNTAFTSAPERSLNAFSWVHKRSWHHQIPHHARLPQLPMTDFVLYK